MSIADKLTHIAENNENIWQRGKSVGYNVGYNDGYISGWGTGFENGSATGKAAQSYEDYQKTTEVIEWQWDAYDDDDKNPLQTPKETFEENIEVIKDNTNALYNRGREEGEEIGKEVGKEQEWNTFWEAFQKGGEPMSYLHAFSNGKFTDANYNPKYPIDCTYTVSSVAQYMFYGSSITDTKVEIIVGANRVLSSTFENCRELVTIPKLTLKGNNGFTSTFENCTSLKNIVINGTIEKVINFQYSPLSRASIESVVNALSNTTSGLTVTFKETAVNNAFTPEEWEALTDEKPNWTFTLA